MRLELVARIAEALAQLQRAHQRRNPGSDVDDRAAGEIEARHFASAGVQQSTLAPDHMRHGEIDEQRPQHHKQEHGTELHALGESARDQGRRDDGEHQLIDHKCLMRDGGRVIRIRIGAHTVQQRIAQIADERGTLTKSQAVTHQRPKHGDYGHQNKTLHHGAEHVLGADKATVEQRQSGSGHHEDQGGAGQHPCVIAGTLGRLGCGFQGSYLRLEILGRLRQQGGRQKYEPKAKIQ